MKSPPVQYHDDEAHALVEAFATGTGASGGGARQDPAAV
jgi:hypothetical protein